MERRHLGVFASNTTVDLGQWLGAMAKVSPRSDQRSPVWPDLLNPRRHLSATSNLNSRPSTPRHLDRWSVAPVSARSSRASSSRRRDTAQHRWRRRRLECPIEADMCAEGHCFWRRVRLQREPPLPDLSAIMQHHHGGRAAGDVRLLTDDARREGCPRACAQRPRACGVGQVVACRRQTCPFAVQHLMAYEQLKTQSRCARRRRWRSCGLRAR